MKFNMALTHLESGYVISRKGWNASGQFCWYVPAGSYPARMEAIKGYYEDDLVPYAPYIAFKNAQGIVVPWVPSTGDLFADDWVVHD